MLPDFPLTDVAIAIPRVAAGVFFAISGAHKLLVPSRHASLVSTLIADHVPAVKFMQWWVPGWELVAGSMLAVGFLTPFAAGVLAVIMAVAVAAEARERVEAYKPLDWTDRIDDYLYLPEVLLLVMLVASALAGGGLFSVDSLLWR